MPRTRLPSKRVLNHLIGIRSNFVFGLQLWAVLSNPDTADIVRSHRLIVTPEGIFAIPPGRTLYIPEGERYYKAEFGGPDRSNYKRAATEFVKLMLRTFTTESFEKLRGYCKDTGQTALMRAQPWYQFARVVRNSLAHSQIWSFNSYDLRQLPITWNGKTITESMNGTEMTWDFYDCFDALELWDEMYAFAETLS